MRIGLLFRVAVLLNFCACAQQVLLSGTSFDPVSNDTSKYYWAIDEIKYYGIQVGKLTVTPSLTPNANANTFNNNHYYAITNNPAKLDNKRYVPLVGNQRDNQLVMSKLPSDGRLLEYVIEGAKPYSNIQVRVKYCYVKKTGGACGSFSGFSSLQTQINPDQYNTANGKDWAYASNSEFCGVSDTAFDATSTTGSTIQPMADGSVKVFIKNNTTNSDTCKVIGIKSIEIWGTPKPRLQNIEDEVCTKELLDLKTKQPYNNVTYQWQVQIGNNTTWVNVGTNASEVYEPQLSGKTKYKFRLLMTTTKAPIQSFISDTLVTEADACCMEAGQPAARKRLYYDDFGRLDPTDPNGYRYIVTDYSDIRNPKLDTITSLYQERWPAVPPPVGLTFDDSRITAISDGEYMVVANLNDANVGYANNITGAGDPVQGYDHSGTKEGALLMMNLVPSNKGNTLYERDFKNLCAGKMVFFQAWATVFTGDPGVDIIAEITDVNSGTKVTDAVIIEPVSKPNGQKTGWQKLSGSLTLTGTNPTLNFKIINNNPTTSKTGNDLVIDDIEIKVCSPPGLDIYFDTVLFNKNVTACDLNKINVLTRPSSLLNGFYGNATHYIYQWTKTPADKSSWQNLTPTSVTATGYMDIKNSASFTELTSNKPTGPIYFRVIAASKTILDNNNNFQGANMANPDDPCGNYTVSDVIEYDVACVLPITWLYLKASKVASGNRLEWATLGSIKNSVFKIQRSEDGVLFNDLGILKSYDFAGLATYVFIDDQGLSGYYRVQNVNSDNSIYVSQMVYVGGENSSLNDGIMIFPNPSEGEFLITGITEGSVIDIMDCQGKVLHKGMIAQDTIMELTVLDKGIYLVKVSSDLGVSTKKVAVR